MLKKRKQLMAQLASASPNLDLVQDIEENTNFLLAKRQHRLKKTKTFNDKYLYHTIGDGQLLGGIIHNGLDNKIQLNSSLNKTITSDYNKYFGLNNVTHDSKINTSNYQLRRPSTANRRDESFIYPSSAPKIKFRKKHEQDDILQSLEYTPTFSLQNDVKSRNVQSQHGHRRSIMQNTNASSQSFYKTIVPKSDKLSNNEFMQKIRNRSIYRRDNLIRHLSNQGNRAPQPDQLIITSPAYKTISNLELPKRSYQIDQETQSPLLKDYSLLQRPQTSSFISKFKNSANIEVKKVPKYYALKQFKDLNTLEQIMITGDNTKGLPDEINPKARPMTSVNMRKAQLQNIVSDLIKNKRDHSVLQSKDKVNIMDTNQITRSLVQVIQPDASKQEFQVISTQPDWKERTRFRSVPRIASKQFKNEGEQESYPFEESQCRQFIARKKDQIQLQMGVVDSNPINFNYGSIEEMGERPLELFLTENQIYPYYYVPSITKKAKGEQVTKFEFFLVKGNQYLNNQDYIKALRFYSEGQKNCPQSDAYRFNIALVHLMDKRYAQSRRMYEKLHLKSPNNATIFMNLLLSLLMMNRHQEIMRFKDKNLSRPRCLMNQQEMSINKIIIYSTSALQRQGPEQVLQDMRDMEASREFLDTEMQQTPKPCQQEEVRQPKYNDLYFKKRTLSSIQKKRPSHQTQKITSSTMQSTMKPQVSLLEQERQQFIQKRQKFNEILELKRQVLKDKDTLFGNIETCIVKTESQRTTSVEQTNRQLYFTIAPVKRSNSLDKVFKQLADTTQIYTAGQRDPIDDKYKELMEDLKVFKNKVGIRKFMKLEERMQATKAEEERERPWTLNKSASKDSNVMRSTQMQRARQFLKSTITNKSKKESKMVIRNIESMLREHTGESISDNRKLEKELNPIIQDLSLNQTNGYIMQEELELDTSLLDQTLIERLENLKDVSQMTEDEKFLAILGITKEDLERRKEMEGDKLLKVLCPDGVTQEERDSFDDDTEQFLQYFYNSFMIKQTCVTGTEVYSLFKDSLEIDVIKKYLDKLSMTITQRFGVFGQITFNEDQEDAKWESPFKHKKKTVYNQLIKKGQDLNAENSAKSSIAFVFLQKINTMGFLNKIVQDNMNKIKQQKSQSVNGNKQLTPQLLKFLDQQYSKKAQSKVVDYQMIDSILYDLKFFAIFEKDIRMKIYKLCSLVQVEDQQILDMNIQKTEYMYVVTSGEVSLVKKDHELGLEVTLGTLKAGECFGDISIQSYTVNPCDILDRNVIYAINDTPCSFVRFERQAFMEAIFREMKVLLYKKIMMLKNAEFFEDLSPYALVILASNILLKEYKLGDILVKQGQIPTKCYILLEGECKAVYEKEVRKSTQVSKFAKKCLQTNLPQPMHYKEVAMKETISKIPEESPNKGKNQKQTYKQSFQNEIMKEDPSQKTINYKHHIQYDQLKPGNCFGYRTLLDKQMIRRHVIDECEQYSDQLQITMDTIQQKYFKPILQKSPLTSQQQLTHQDSQTLQYNPSELKLNLRLINKINEATESVTMLLNDTESNPTKKLSGLMAPSHLQEELSPRRDEDELQTRKHMVMRSKLYDNLMEELQKAQVSIIANSAVVKVMIIKREDKNFLNETLKNIIDRKLLEKRFKDYDRPRANMQEILKIGDEEQEWKNYKARLETDMLREVAMTKKLNKLLD